VNKKPNSDALKSVYMQLGLYAAAILSIIITCAFSNSQLSYDRLGCYLKGLTLAHFRRAHQLLSEKFFRDLQYWDNTITYTFTHTLHIYKHTFVT